MENKTDNTKISNPQGESAPSSKEFPGYPTYPESEDIYEKSHKEANIMPEEVTQLKDLTEDDKLETIREKSFDEDSIAKELDIPGSELDDRQEDTGSEDEENNYYSIGSDNHDDLEEDRGE